MALYDYQAFESSNILDSVKGVKFYVPSWEEIEQRSAVKNSVSKADSYDKNNPIIEGIFDPHMGRQNGICNTCFQSKTLCPGHFGHIHLSEPLFFTHYANEIQSICEMVCWACSRLKMQPTSADIQRVCSKNISSYNQFSQIKKIITKPVIRTCWNCDQEIPKKIQWNGKDKQYLIFTFARQNENIIQHWYASHVYTMFFRIPDEDCRVMGLDPDYTHPRNLICRYVPVPPPSIRPSMENDTGMRMEDDMTVKIREIVKNEKQLKQKKEQNESAQHIRYQIEANQTVFRTYIDNSDGLSKHAQNSKPIKSVQSRISGKEGRIRNNLMGKRVDFSGRSVITPDPEIDLDEVGVPYLIAMNLTFPETANVYNIDKLRERVSNGPYHYPGAKSVKKVHQMNRVVWLTIDTVDVSYGDVVHRHLEDGDIVKFNRQPSLHKMSIMGHRARILPGLTYRLNPNVLPAYAGDFDGDEMNLHLPQSYLTQYEVKEVSAVSKQMINPKNSAPIIAPIQDTVLSSYLLTLPDTQVDDSTYYDMLTISSIVQEPTKAQRNVSGKQLWSGRSVMSTIFPSTLNIDADGLTITNGELKDGIINKDNFSEHGSGILHQIYNYDGSDEAMHFMNNLARCTNRWQKTFGHSVGLADVIIDDASKEKKREALQQYKQDAHDVIRSIHDGTFENNNPHSNSQELERRIKEALENPKFSTISSQSTPVSERMTAMLKDVGSGSKGKPDNLVQMAFALRQQVFPGGRAPKGFDNRTFPCFQKSDHSPEAGGFVENSFIEGLSPLETFFHAMTGRNGLIDTAVSTADTGYIQRRLVKALEDIMVRSDLTVRNSAGIIVQHMYSGDGINPTCLEKQKPKYGDTLNNVRASFLLTEEDIDTTLMSVQTSEAHKRTKDEAKDWVPAIWDFYNAIVDDRHYIYTTMYRYGYITDKGLNSPVNFIRCKTYTYSHHEYHTKSDMTPKDVLDAISNLNEEIGINPTVRLLVRNQFNPRSIIVHWGFTKNMLDYCISLVKQSFYRSIADPGTMVGVLAAQGIGEPSTQLALDSFHSAGTASGAGAIGSVPRLNELLGVKTNTNHRTSTIYLNNTKERSIKDDFHQANEFANSIQMTYLKNIVDYASVYYEPNEELTTIEDDKVFTSVFNQVVEWLDDEYSMPESPWLLRMVFNKEAMFQNNISMYDVERAIRNKYQWASCVFSDDNAERLVMRIRIANSNSEDIKTLIDFQMKHLETFTIKGIPNIYFSHTPQKVRNGSEDDQKEYNPNTMDFEPNDSYLIHVDGSNLLYLLSLPEVDAQRTYSNDIQEIYSTLGIEAVRTYIIWEISKLFEEQGVEKRHIKLLVDCMTHKGFPVPINRHGWRDSSVGALTKASFEESAKMLSLAGVFSQYDNMQGVSSNIMLGQIVQAGTAYSKLSLDTDKLQNVAPLDINVGAQTSKKVPVLTDNVDLNADMEFEIPHENENTKGIKRNEKIQNVQIKHI